jgi:hypothetical protein
MRCNVHGTATLPLKTSRFFKPLQQAKSSITELRSLRKGWLPLTSLLDTVGGNFRKRSATASQAQRTA